MNWNEETMLMDLNASWIWTHDQPDRVKQSVFFRRTHRMEHVVPVILRISADSLFKLAVNGHHVLVGPLKGDRFRKYYDTIDITDYLCAGENVLAVHVLRMSPDYLTSMNFKNGAVSVVSSSRGGLWISCETVPAWNTTGEWKCMKDESYSFVEAEQSQYAGDREMVDGRFVPAGWRLAGYDDSGWSSAVVVCSSDNARTHGVLYEWQLTKRDIPLLYETPIRPVAIAANDGAVDYSAILTGGSFDIPPGEHWFDIDMGELVNAYVTLDMESHGSADVAVELEYCEAYLTPSVDSVLYKGRRDNQETGVLAGEKDRYRARSGRQQYEPFWYRVFRYLRVWIFAGQSSTIHGTSFRLTGYPLKIKGHFSAEDETYNHMWAISRRTVERCMMDTYMDCPYYEQMQYLMDSSIQMLLSYQLSADDRLARKALLDFHATRRPDGMITCNAPSSVVQIIPLFSIYYIDMLVYHYQYYGDQALIARYLPTVMGILQYFFNRMDPETGLVRDVGYWRFVDWVDEWQANYGCPTGDPEETVYIFSLIVAYGVKQCIWLCGELGLADVQDILNERYERLTDGINAEGFDKQSGYYRTHEKEIFHSQHAQVWAVLSGCVRGEAATELMRCCIGNKEFLPCSYAMLFYLLRACEEVGVYDEYTEKWMPWQRLLSQRITTWPEDDITVRSDCHAWSAVPLYDFSAVIMGLRPGKPGFEELLLSPHSPEMGDMHVVLPTIKGTVEAMRTVKDTADGYHMQYILHMPPGMTLRVQYPDGTRRLYDRPDVHVDFHYVNWALPLKTIGK